MIGNYQVRFLGGKASESLLTYPVFIIKVSQIRPFLALLNAAKLCIIMYRIMCKRRRMATNLALDDQLIAEAQQVGNHKTKYETVTHALLEYIQKRKQLSIIDNFGAIDFDSKYNYKKSSILIF